MKKRKYVASLTTSPARISHIEPTLNSLLRQTRPPEMILLNLPDAFLRTGEAYDVPAWIHEMATVNRCGQDLGPATKLAPTVELLKSSPETWGEGTHIVYADDDVDYPEGLIEAYDLAIQNETDVWALSCMDFVDLHPRKARGHGQKAAVAEAFGSACAPLSLFQDDFLGYIRRWAMHLDTRLSDDVVISNYYHSKGAAPRTLNRPGISSHDLWNQGRILPHGMMADALHLGAGGTSTDNTDRYTRAIQLLDLAGERHFEITFENQLLETLYNLEKEL